MEVWFPPGFPHPVGAGPRACRASWGEEVVSSFPFFFIFKKLEFSFPKCCVWEASSIHTSGWQAEPALRQHSMLQVPRLLDSWRWEGNRHPQGTGPGSQMLVPFTITTAQFCRDGFLCFSLSAIAHSGWEPGWYPKGGSVLHRHRRRCRWALLTEAPEPGPHINREHEAPCHCGWANGRGQPPGRHAEPGLRPLPPGHSGLLPALRATETLPVPALSPILSYCLKQQACARHANSPTWSQDLGPCYGIWQGPLSCWIFFFLRQLVIACLYSLSVMSVKKNPATEYP